MEINNQIDWGWSKKLILVRQTENAECGVACLAMIADWYGHKISLRRLREKCNVTKHGMSFSRLIECAELLDLSCRAIRLELDELSKLSTPCILHWDLNHFVVLKSVKGNEVEIHDPANGVVKSSVREVDKHFTGIALELLPTHTFQPRNEKEHISVLDIVGKTIGLKSSIVKILSFALTFEALALLLPMTSQVVIDQVLVGYDENLLVLVIAAVIIITAIQTIVSIAKQWATISLSVSFNTQWTANVFHHLFRLPIDWFEKRDIGSICAKFSSINSIQDILTVGVIQAMLDLILVVGTLSVMILYSPLLSGIAVASSFAYMILRFAWFGSFKRAEENTWEASAREESYFIETISGILSLRVNGALYWREEHWKNLNIGRRNAQLHELKLGMIYNTISISTISIASASVLWFGAGLVLAGQFSIGMLVAFLSYQGRFSSCISSLIDKYFEYKTLSVYSERISDIVLTEKEPGDKVVFGSVNSSCMIDNHCVVEFSGVTFSYGEGELALLNNTSLKIIKGDVVSIIGDSGCGKSTIFKLLLGLYEPKAGDIKLFDGIVSSVNETRRRIGAVLQEDRLFSGSIIENITFFSSDYDESWLVKCAKIACIHDDIERLNMRYHTLIGEMGTGLSGGQKQRILIARALYKKPELLILDEATSSLDINTETRVCNSLRETGITVLMIAHRPETIASADRVFLLQSGSITEVENPY